MVSLPSEMWSIDTRIYCRGKKHSTLYLCNVLEGGFFLNRILSDVLFLLFSDNCALERRGVLANGPKAL